MMGGLFARYGVLMKLVSSARLALRLLRDPRTPIVPKLILGAAIVYVLSPIDLIPDIFPILGQMDDLAVITLGLEMFFRYVPDWLKAEHEAEINATQRGGRIVDVPPGPARRA